MHDQTYIIGHVNPGTGSIASAMGYAWLLREWRRNPATSKKVWRACQGKIEGK